MFAVGIESRTGSQGPRRTRIHERSASKGVYCVSLQKTSYRKQSYGHGVSRAALSAACHSVDEEFASGLADTLRKSVRLGRDDGVTVRWRTASTQHTNHKLVSEVQFRLGPRALVFVSDSPKTGES